MMKSEVKTWLAKLPERTYVCPTCYKPVMIPAHKIAVDCQCGNLVFRPLTREVDA